MKNHRLKLKDLFNGRVVYLAEPNIHPTKMVCGQKYIRCLEWSTVILDTSGRDPAEVLKEHNGEYKIVPNEWLVKMAKASDKPLPEGIGLIKKHVTQTVNIEMTDENGQKHYFQDIYFDPSESRLKVFATLKQAMRYSDYPETFGKDLETIYSKTE